MDKSAAYRSYLPWLAALLALSLVAVFYDAQITGVLVCFTRGHLGLARATRLVSDWGNYVFYVGSGLALLVGLARRDKVLIRLGLAYLLTLFLFSFAVGRLIKIGVGRPRPWVGDALPCRPLSLQDSYNSFPSGHASDAFAAVAPAFRWLRSPLIKAAVLGIAVLIGLSRIMLAQHYPTDVLMGAVLSVGGGLLVTRGLERWRALESQGTGGADV
jgi:membrane-associated phospholipid phosphatase